MGKNMNLKTVIENLIHFFARKEIDFAVIGAFALKAYGYVRATQDVDFLVRGKDQEKIIPFLETLGYETRYRSKRVFKPSSPTGTPRPHRFRVRGR